MIEEGIVSLLSANAPLTALIGTRLFPVLVPEGFMPVNAGDSPCLSYQVISNVPTYTLATNEYNEKRIQFDGWGVTYSDCNNVKAAVRTVLDGYVGTLDDGTRVLSTLRGIETNFWESDARVYRTLFEYIFRFVEP